jgi:proteic killer suppression protein
LFRHKGLKELYKGKSERRISPAHIVRLRDILFLLDQATGPEKMNVRGLRFHPLKGDLKGHYSVSVSGNWRVTFRCESGQAVDVDYMDYH